MSARGWRVAFGVLCIVIGDVFFFLAGRASAAPGPQAVSDRTADWLSIVLKHDVERRDVRVTELMGVDHFGEYDPATGAVSLRPWVASGLSPAEGEYVGFGPSPPSVLVHELLHRRGSLPCWRDNGGGGAAGDEEGAVQAVAMDVLHAWHARFWGSARGADGVRTAYPADVARVRAYSRFATGSRSWRPRAARLWRRDFLFAPCDLRRAMASEANSAALAFGL